jgi:hypothetical protein
MPFSPPWWIFLIDLGAIALAWYLRRKSKRARRKVE